MPIALDTNVIVYSIYDISQAASDRHRVMIRDSKSLLESQNEFWISPVVEAEIIPYVDPADVLKMKLTDARFLPFDSSVIAEASAILRAAGQATERCKVCWVPDEHKKCGMCKRLTRGTDMLHDALLIAGVAHSAVDVLYSYDSGVLELAQYATKRAVTVAEPPNSLGALFAHAEAASGAKP